MKQYNVPNIYSQINKNSLTSALVVNVPGSKSITNRALLLATLSDTPVILNGVLFSDDSRNFLKCIQNLGIDTDVNEETHTVKIIGCNNRIPLKEASVYVGSAGTAARFISAVLGVSNGIYHLDSSEQMRKRPMKPLLDSLKELGCEVLYEKDKYPESVEDHFPYVLKSHGFCQNHITVNIDSSSQFLSALMIASVLSENGLTINVTGTHGKAYIEMTRLMMKQFGVTCDIKNDSDYYIAPGQHYHSDNYDIEPDASAAAYFYSLAPLLGIDVLVPGIHKDSLQGDLQFIECLVSMGCTSHETENGIILSAPTDGEFNGIDIDMSTFSDQAITLAAIAPYATSPTTIRGIGHIRYQECDRLSAIINELQKMNIKTENGDDWIKIYPGKPSPSIINTYEDHRMAMGFSLIGLRSQGIVIDNPLCCKKTFENYFEVLDSVINEITK